MHMITNHEQKSKVDAIFEGNHKTVKQSCNWMFYNKYSDAICWNCNLFERDQEENESKYHT